jgi:hypothetical protein
MFAEGGRSLAELHHVRFAMGASCAEMLVQLRTLIAFE